ncbi:MAG TPA: hypothetical protein VI160_06835 [Gemmatimonadales bacterium]
MLLALAALLMLQSQDTASYLDAGARDLVTRGRAARIAETTITSYRALARERIYLGLRALRRDRVFYHREMAVRLHWHRDGPDTVDAVGAREGIPIAFAHDSIPDDLASDAPDPLWDPTSDRLTLGGGDDSSFVRHPLAAGSEADYQFRSGDTTTLTLSNGTEVRLYELRVIPRRTEFHLMAGSLWLESRGYSVVRALFRPARPFDFDRDVEHDDSAKKGDHIPGLLKPIRAEVRYVTVEYGLWQSRWWLPRLSAIDAVASAGSFLTTPLRYETSWDAWEITADSVARPRASARDSATRDSVRLACRGNAACHCRRHSCEQVVVNFPADTASLLTSPELPPSFVTSSQAMMQPGELNALLNDLHVLPQAGEAALRPGIQVGLGAPGLLRYNRVEGLSVGARAAVTVGASGAEAVARIGTADWQPGLELAVIRASPDLTWRVGAYRRLVPVDPATRALGFGNSLGALLLGRDDGDYFRAAGLDLTVTPALAAPQHFSWRIFAEHQFVARRETDLSVPHLVHASRVFRQNIAADRADQVGTQLTLRGAHPFAEGRGNVGADAILDVSTGTFTFGRLGLTLRAGGPLLLGLAGALEAAGGTTAGAVPQQSRWYLGGPATLRGYAGDAADGDAFWRVRAEVANAFPGARLALFTDAGWAGARPDAFRIHPLISAGAGLSFLDGLVRLDVARALRAPRGWRLELYSDAAL